MTIRTVETSDGIYAQGDLVAVDDDHGIARVKVGNTIHTGKLVECLKKCTPDASPYQ